LPLDNLLVSKDENAVEVAGDGALDLGFAECKPL
jgi:hypothetical protein